MRALRGGAGLGRGHCTLGADTRSSWGLRSATSPTSCCTHTTTITRSTATTDLRSQHLSSMYVYTLWCARVRFSSGGDCGRTWREQHRTTAAGIPAAQFDPNRHRDGSSCSFMCTTYRTTLGGAGRAPPRQRMCTAALLRVHKSSTLRVSTGLHKPGVVNNPVKEVALCHRT